MNKLLILLPLLLISIASEAQKGKKGKSTTPVIDSSGNYTAPVIKGKSKGKTIQITDSTASSSSKKGKKDDKKSVANTNYTPEVETPVLDTSKLFTGLIKYRMTDDDPADKDSIFIYFGVNKIKVTMFQPGYREGQTFETSMIADLADSIFYELNPRNQTYTKEKLGIRNDSTQFTLSNSKKIGQIMNIACQEYAGEMTTGEGDTFQAACLVSPQQYYAYAVNFNFMNVHPLVLGYKIVLGFRTKSADNENTYIIAYKIEPGNHDEWFDLSSYHLK